MLFNFFVSLVVVSLFFVPNFNFIIEPEIAAQIEQFNQTVSASPSNQPQRIVNNSLGIETSSKSLVVADSDSGAILFAKNQNQVLPIASITKLMTALIFLEHNPGWDKVVEIKKEDARKGGIIHLFAGETVTVSDLFNLSLVASANEAAAALARSTGLSSGEFVNLMNQKAEELGLENTTFTDSTGLEPTNVSTALDIVKLAKTAFSNRAIINTCQQEKYEFTILNKKIKRQATNTNELLKGFLNDGKNYWLIGAKTGYLDEALYCVTVQIKQKDDHRIIVVILGSPSKEVRWQEVKGLTEWVFENYKWPGS